ncbi:probable L-ascorbate peroxidase 6, chloroplastic/mitochondrial isoform X3 [Juglans microcarpa x Juglans regia]|uniref:probable L-ascorbate peroxidase 6, chloroplastic/mitochondrial isoform X3 n=1 Tax=Juglans microcarpa x Juglans regia TaxID=2249226 RepID=UPI001B7F72FA|nr:probable L-ascorbate peroxidase 6, chloroplastic/mitochondrial isoform X3 [Juglans microcarpa x Juglans regia]
MAERLALTLSPLPSQSSPAMASLFGTHAAASSRIVPNTSAAAPSTRLSFSSSSSSSSSSSTSLASLRFLRSSPPVSHLFLNSKKRLLVVPLVSKRGLSAAVTPKCAASDPDQLKGAREDIKAILKANFCHPILVRLGWHDAGTYNKNIQEWPQRGGANGSLRFEIELKHAANAGLVNALKLIQPIKDKYPGVTYADLFQLASATAIEDAGGPKIPMKYGRVDVTTPTDCPEEGRLPVSFGVIVMKEACTLRSSFFANGFSSAIELPVAKKNAGPPSPADHLREVFYRMGLSDKEIVALSGAHTLGRSRPERSGWGKSETKYTKDGPGAPGGQSWTVQWLKFDNSYFKDIKQRRDEDLLVLPTDAVLFEDPSFKVYAEKYAEDQEAFFKDYAEAHAKLSNLGAKFDPAEGIVINDGSSGSAPEKFVASKYSSGKD